MEMEMDEHEDIAETSSLGTETDSPKLYTTSDDHELPPPQPKQYLRGGTMKVLNAIETTLPNAEVYQFLSTLITRYETHPDFSGKESARLRRLYRVSRDVVSYLEGSEVMAGMISVMKQQETEQPDGNGTTNTGSSVTRPALTGFKPYDMLPDINAQNKTANAMLQSHITTFFSALQKIPTLTGKASDKLTKSEALMMIHVIPVAQPVLECVVEEIEERYGEEQQEEMMRLCRWFGNVTETKGENGSGDGQSGGEGEDADMDA